MCAVSFQLIVVLLGLLATKPTTVVHLPMELPGLSHHWLRVDSTFKGDLVDREFRIVTGTSIGSADKVVGSFWASNVTAGDSNVICYITSGIDSLFLVFLRLSPVQTFDTVYSMSARDSANWLKRAALGFQVVSRDSIISFLWGGDRSGGRVHTFKILPENQYVYKGSIYPVVGGSTTSSDFQQFLYCVVDSLRPYDTASRCIVVYDALADSVFVLMRACACAGPLLRFTSTGPVFFKRHIGQVDNLVMFAPGIGIRQLTDIHFPQRLELYWRTDNRIGIIVSGTGLASSGSGRFYFSVDSLLRSVSTLDTSTR